MADEIIETGSIAIEEIIIDEQFKAILPRLDDKTRADLELSLLKYGCKYPLILWNKVLIDGHNRYEIIKAHDIPFRVVSMEFDSREDVVIWIIDIQIARRNLTSIQLSFYRGLHYNTDKERHGSSARFTAILPSYQSDNLESTLRTVQRLSEQYDVSTSTIIRDARLASAINAIGAKSPEAKAKILAGQGNISRTQLRELSSGSDELVSETIDKIIEGTHLPRRSRASESQNGSVTAPHTPQYEQLTIDGFISKMTHDVSSGISSLTQGNTEQSKTALRALINQLEELYRGM